MANSRLLIIFAILVVASPFAVASAKKVIYTPDVIVTNGLNPPKPASSPKADAVHAERQFKSKIVNLEFTYTADSRYVEVDFAKLFSKNKKGRGHLINIIDRRGRGPSFVAVTDKVDVPDAKLGDTLVGTLDSADSFRLENIDEKTAVSRQLSPGVYYYIGRPTVDCGGHVAAYLVVKSTLKSKIKYFIFYLGQTILPLNADGSVPCDQNEDLVRARIDDLAENRVPEIKAQLDKALAIVKTLSNK
jgi:hypothetical protein